MTTLIMGPWHFSLAGEGVVVRAQNGPVQQVSYPVYSDVEYCEDCEDGSCFRHLSPFGKVGHCFRYVTTLGGKPAGRYPNAYSNQGFNQDGSLGQNNFQYRYRYKAPDDLRYPPANQPAGVVVYPYYTVKGPDDFFLNK